MVLMAWTRVIPDVLSNKVMGYELAGQNPTLFRNRLRLGTGS